MLLQEGELIPISPLKCSFSANNLEEPASEQAQRVPPLQDRPLSVFKYVLNNTDHLGCGGFFCEHISDSGAAGDRGVGNLMIDCIVVVQADNGIHISAVKGVCP